MNTPLPTGGSYVIGEDGRPVLAEPPTGPAKGRRWSQARNEPPAAVAATPEAEAEPPAEVPPAADAAGTVRTEPAPRRTKGAA